MDTEFENLVRQLYPNLEIARVPQIGSVRLRYNRVSQTGEAVQILKDWIAHEKEDVYQQLQTLRAAAEYSCGNQNIIPYVCPTDAIICQYATLFIPTLQPTDRLEFLAVFLDKMPVIHQLQRQFIIHELSQAEHCI